MLGIERENALVYADGGVRPLLLLVPARDLVQALQGLLSARNDLLNTWVNQQVQRLNLDLDLGTMQLDPTGNWIDPGSDFAGGAAACEPDVAASNEAELVQPLQDAPNLPDSVEPPLPVDPGEDLPEPVASSPAPLKWRGPND